MNTESNTKIKLEELLSKISDGKERYKKSPMFQYYVTELLNGVDPIVLIEGLVRITENSIKEISKLNLPKLELIQTDKEYPYQTRCQDFSKLPGLLNDGFIIMGEPNVYNKKLP